MRTSYDMKMSGTIGPDVASAAVSLRRSHPHVSAADVLDVVMRGRTGSLADFGESIEPATPFGFLIAEAFDDGMAPRDWALVTHPNTDPRPVVKQTRFAPPATWPVAETGSKPGVSMNTKPLARTASA